jgi:uncharacterized protein (TIGR02270 family)
MRKLIPGIVAQHAEEAADLWSVRAVLVSEPHMSLRDLARWDERVDAHVDGLRIAGPSAAEICDEALAGETPGEVFALFLWAVSSGDKTKQDAAVAAAASSPELARGLVSGLGWLSFEQAQPHIEQLAAADDPALRRIAIAAAALHRQHPGRPLSDAARDPDARLRGRALRAIAEIGLADALPMVHRNLSADDPTVRFWAAWSGVLLGRDANAVTILKAEAEGDGANRERALHVVIRRLPISAARTWQDSLRAKPARARFAILAAGASGDPSAAPWLLDRMEEPLLARAAGEAFTMITGADLAAEGLRGKPPEKFEPGPSDDPDSEATEMDPDENLAWPAPDAVRAWWKAHAGGFPQGTRHLLGKPVGEDWLRAILRTGKQRQRAAAALELALMRAGQPLFEVRAPGFRQQNVLA